MFGRIVIKIRADKGSGESKRSDRKRELQEMESRDRNKGRWGARTEVKLIITPGLVGNMDSKGFGNHTVISVRGR